jgi:DNA processing protein
VLRQDRPEGERQAAYPLRVLPESLADPVLDALDGSPTTLDTLAQTTGLTLDALSAKLLTLELDGRIASLPGGRYQKIH